MDHFTDDIGAGHRRLLEDGSSVRDDATAAINFTASDGGKLQLIFCVERACPPDHTSC